MFAIKKLSAIILSGLLVCNELVAQHTTNDTGFYELSLDNAINFYTDKLGGYRNLYNGPEYTYQFATIKGHPYYKTDSMQSSFLFYDGILYRSIPLKYDLATGEVVLKSKQNRLLKLVPEKLDYFSIGDDLFVHVRKDSNNNELPAPGFYHVLYEGQLTALVSRKKTPKRALRAEDPYEFAIYNTYFIKKNGSYIRVNSKKDLLTVFGTNKESVRNYLRKSRANFKRDREGTIRKAIDYYSGAKK